MKVTKAFLKMSLQDQETYLISKLQEVHQTEDEIKKMLASVRGGYKYEATTEVDRPDLLELKGDN